MNPTRALEEQRVLLARLSQPMWPRYMTSWMENVQRKSGQIYFANSDGNADGSLFVLGETQRLKMSDTYYVSEEMIPLIQWGTASLSDVDHFDRTLWPSDYGFVWFGEPVTTTELYGRTASYAAMSWGRRIAQVVVDKRTGRTEDVAGTFVVFYTDITSPNDMNMELIEAFGERVTEGLGRMQVLHMFWIADDERVGPSRLVPPEDAARYAVGGLPMADDSPNPMRFILSMLMMLNQTVTDVSEHHLDKKGARRMRFMGLPSKVTVVRLRRTAGMERLEGESLVEWAHRWIVKGHWRNQPYKNDDGTTRYERIWIAPYVKGPEGKPLKQSEKVYALVR